MKGFETLTMQDLEIDPDRGGYCLHDDTSRHSSTVSLADVESRVGDEPLGTQKAQRLDSPCRIHIHSRRYRHTDADGVCGKYVIDGLVHAGILTNDSPKEVEAVTFSQETIPTSEPEETILTLTWESENPDIVGCSSPADP